MAKKVLVAYASKYGSTAGIAEKIGEIMAEQGIDVDVSEVNKVAGLRKYDAIVLGSAVYIGKWRKDAVRFVNVFEKELNEKKVWIFSTGPTGKGDPSVLLEGWNMPKNLEPLVKLIAPEDITIFHGSLDIDKLNGVHRFMIKKVKAPIGDFRVWEDIRAWAEKIAHELLK